MADYQLAVAGGGPAGARTAELLARQGLSVVLFEAGGAGHEVLCSGLLNKEAQAALGTELPAHVRVEPFRPLLEFCDLDNRIRRRYDPDYWNMSRPLFDRWLRDRAVSAGADVRMESRVRRLEPVEGGVALHVGRDRIRARIAVDATGWRSISRKLLGVRVAPQVHAFQGLCSVGIQDDAMVAMYKSAATPYFGWIVPKGGGQFLLGAGFPQGSQATRSQQDDPWLKLAPFADALNEAGHAVDTSLGKPIGHPITCLSNMNQLWWGGNGIFPVGEAAGMVSPSSGDGISYCLQGAAALAGALAELDLSSLLYSPAGLDPADHNRIARRARQLMRPALAELRFNIVKAWTAARPALRGPAAGLLPLFLRRKVDVLPAWN